MRLPEFGVRYPITNIMIFSAVLVVGLFSLSRMAIDLMPDIEPPAISVITEYEGAGAEDVETKVTEVIENQIGVVSKILKIRSRSFEGFSVVTAEFEWGADLDEASNEIRDRLEFAKRFLPDDIETPIVFKFNTSIYPITVYGVSAGESYAKLYDLISDEVGDKLKIIPGVGAIQVIGALERQINVEIYKDKLEAYNLSLDEVSKKLAQENITLPAGEIKSGMSEYTLRVPGEFEKPDELNEVIVGERGGAYIYLKDVAKISDSFKEQGVYIRANGRSGLMMIVQKRSGANTVNTVRDIKRKIEDLKKRLPPDIELNLILDSSEFIVDSLKSLSHTIYAGGIFVILIVWLFLMQIRPSFIVAMTIPFSLIITFIFMYFFGYTINIMTLSSLAIAIGMVVDNAIVVVDNVFRHKDKGVDVKLASIEGTSEMMLAVGASTLTTVAVFFPLMFLKGITGIMFKQLASMVIIALMASLFTALTFTPMLCSKLLTEKKISYPNFFTKFLASFNAFFKKVDERYAASLHWALFHKKIVILSAIILLAVSIGLVKMIGTEFMPEEDTNELRVNASLPVGTRVEETDRVAKQLEEIFMKAVPETVTLYSRAGQPSRGVGAAFSRSSGSHFINMGAKLKRKGERKRSTKEIAQALRREILKVPGIDKLSVETGSFLSRMLVGGMGKPFSVEIIGHDILETNKLASDIRDMLEGIPGAVDVTISRELGKPELRVKLDREKASALGLSVSQITDEVRTAFYGKAVTRYRERGNEYDIFVRLIDEDRRTLEDLNSLTIKSAKGGMIRLSNIATVYEGMGPTEIERRDRERIVTVDANVHGRSIGEIAKELKLKMAKLQIPFGMVVQFGGHLEEQRKAFRDLLLVLALSVLLVYMVMASQFESLLDPLVIMLGVPFAFVGVGVTLFLTNTTFNIASFIGMIMLTGIVVNNGILLVSYIIMLRQRGLNLVDAIKESGRTRLRPILMTTITTLLGMTPLAFFHGEGSEIWSPLGITMIGGLLLSTLVTLILIPTLYYIFEVRIKNHELV